MAEKCKTCGKKKTSISLVANPSVPFGATIPHQSLYPIGAVEACEKCDREKFKDSLPNVHAYLNRDKLSYEERVYRFGFEVNNAPNV